ncbi:MAG: OmpH family outer membrane protein [Pseudomonadota bacterium]
MFFIRVAFIALALIVGVTSTSISVPAAEAQGTKVIVINQGKIYRDSRSGQDIEAKVANIERSMQAELKPMADNLNAKSQALQPRLQGKTMDQVRADPALVSELQKFETDLASHQRNQQIKAAELQATIRKARADWAKALEPVLQEVMTEQAADIMVARGELVYAAPSTDVTASVISKLDTRTPSISVVRQRLPQQPAQ